MAPKVPVAHDLIGKATRRQAFSVSTKKALVDVASRLFTEHGYAGTSLDEIVAGAKVTKGAVYHHFKGKQELFEAVFTQVEEEATDQIRRATRGVPDPWQKAVTALQEFLEVTRSEKYRRIVIQEGPSVLGYERFREQEERNTFGLVHEIVSALLSPTALPDSTLESFSRIFFGALSATGAAVSTAEDPQRASDQAESALLLMLAGIRALLDSGEDLADAVSALRPGARLSE